MGTDENLEGRKTEAKGAIFEGGELDETEGLGVLAT